MKFSLNTVTIKIRVIMATQSQVDNWVEKSIAKENLKDYVIKIIGGSEKGDGFLGDIVFVEVEGSTQENEPVKIHLVVKHAKSNEHFRESMPVKLFFETEIYMYTTVIPAFQKFQQENHVDDIFDSVAKCYYSSSLGDVEVLVLENLKIAGYEQYDRKKPMNLSHCKEILKQYGKFHAISFAMRHQNKERFTELASKLQDAQLKVLGIAEFGRVHENSKNFILELFKKNGDCKLYEKLSNLLQKGAHATLKETLNMKDSQYVISHGDPWCNNFLLKYEEGNKESPSKVAILDWQLSSLRSPVFDLSYFLYGVCSKTELDSFDDLLEFYHNCFSAHVTKLGGDPEELFSYSDLKTHWKKYSVFGLISMSTAIRFCLCDNDVVPSFENKEEGETFADMFERCTYDDEKPIYDRLKAMVSHYFDFLEKEL